VIESATHHLGDGSGNEGIFFEKIFTLPSGFTNATLNFDFVPPIGPNFESPPEVFISGASAGSIQPFFPSFSTNSCWQTNPDSSHDYNCGFHVSLPVTSLVVAGSNVFRIQNGRPADDYDFANVSIDLLLSGTNSFVPPQITSQPANQTVTQSGSATFTVAAAGTAPLSYRWQFNGTDLTDNAHIIGSQSNSLTLANLQVSDAGGYQVVVTNAYGSTNSAVATLTVDTCVSPAAGLVSWWRAEGNANDSASINNGALTNGAGFAPGKWGRPSVWTVRTTTSKFREPQRCSTREQTLLRLRRGLRRRTRFRPDTDSASSSATPARQISRCFWETMGRSTASSRDRARRTGRTSPVRPY